MGEKANYQERRIALTSASEEPECGQNRTEVDRNGGKFREARFHLRFTETGNSGGLPSLPCLAPRNKGQRARPDADSGFRISRPGLPGTTRQTFPKFLTRRPGIVSLRQPESAVISPRSVGSLRGGFSIKSPTHLLYLLPHNPLSWPTSRMNTLKLFSNRSRALALFALTLIPISGPVSAAVVHASWTGAPFGNTAYVTLTAEVDLPNYAFDLGPAGGFAHAWWYAPPAFSEVQVTVTGSANSLFNGAFGTDSMNWIRIYSNSPTPMEALGDGASYADLGASYSVNYAPSDSGIGRLQVGAVGGSGGEYVSSLPISAVPEPTGISLLGLAAMAALAQRRRPRARREFFDRYPR